MNSSSRDAFIAPKTCRLLVGFVPDKGVASSSMRFFLLYLLIIERDKERDRRLLLRGFRLPSIDLPSPYTPLAFRPSKSLLKVSFHFLKSFVCS